jgi:hypothetical protein
MEGYVKLHKVVKNIYEPISFLEINRNGTSWKGLADKIRIVKLPLYSNVHFFA